MTSYFANLLGAVGLALTDAVDSALQSDGDAAALVLLALRPRTRVGRLAERLRLSHPGAVRLADRLVTAGLAERSRGEDRREVRLSLTPAGAARVDEIRAARAGRLEPIAAGLSDAERAALQPLLERLLRATVETPIDAYAHCRLCDTPACEACGCPVEAEARARFAAPRTSDDLTPGA